MAYEPEAAQAFSPEDFGSFSRVLDQYYGYTDSFLAMAHSMGELVADYRAEDGGTPRFPGLLVDELHATHHDFIYSFQSAAHYVLAHGELRSRGDKANGVASLMLYAISGYSFDPDNPRSGLGTRPPQNLTPEAEQQHAHNEKNHALQSEVMLRAITPTVSQLLTGRNMPAPRANTITRAFNRVIVNNVSRDLGVGLETEVKFPHMAPVELAFLAGKAVAIAGITVGLMDREGRKTAEVILRSLWQARF